MKPGQIVYTMLYMAKTREGGEEVEYRVEGILATFETRAQCDAACEVANKAIGKVNDLGFAHKHMAWGTTYMPERINMYVPVTSWSYETVELLPSHGRTPVKGRQGGGEEEEG